MFQRHCGCRSCVQCEWCNRMLCMCCQLLPDGHSWRSVLCRYLLTTLANFSRKLLTCITPQPQMTNGQNGKALQNGAKSRITRTAYVLCSLCFVVGKTCARISNKFTVPSVANVCVCPNGTSDASSACSTNGATECSACAANYYLTGTAGAQSCAGTCSQLSPTSHENS